MSYSATYEMSPPSFWTAPQGHAYNRAILETLDSALQIIKTPVLVIGSTGTGAFCGGADLDEMKNASPEDAHRLYSQSFPTHR